MANQDTDRSVAIPNTTSDGSGRNPRDCSSQYASEAYQKQLMAAGLICSMSRKSNCYDNAAMESFWHSLKVEWLYDFDFETRREAVCEIEDYIDSFYNRERSHSSLGYVSPIEFEAMEKLEKCA